MSSISTKTKPYSQWLVLNYQAVIWNAYVVGMSILDCQLHRLCSAVALDCKCDTAIIPIFYCFFSKHCSCHHPPAYSYSSTPYRPLNPDAVSFVFYFPTPHFLATITSTTPNSYNAAPQAFPFNAHLFFFQLAVPVSFHNNFTLYRILPQVSLLLNREFYLLFPCSTGNPMSPSTHPVWVNTASVLHVWDLAYAACQKSCIFQVLNKQH